MNPISPTPPENRDDERAFLHLTQSQRHKVAKEAIRATPAVYAELGCRKTAKRFGIGDNKANDYIREATDRPMNPVKSKAATKGNAQRKFLKSDEGKELLARLDPLTREIIRLVVGENMDFDEIGVRLGVTESRIRKFWNDANEYLPEPLRKVA